MTQTAAAYGEALYDLARDEGLSDLILGELTALCQSFRQEPAYLKLLGTPNLPKAERCGVLDQAFRGKLHPYVLNFLKILTEKGYIKQFFACREAFEDRYNHDHGILPVKAVSAVALTPEQIQRLTKKLETLTGKTVKLFNSVDPRVIGGLRLDYDGKRLDSTLATRLEAVRSLLKNTRL